jgi:hypothetical protein
MDQAEAPLAALTRFAVHLTARIEALETLLIQKEVATKEEIRAAIVHAEAGLRVFDQSILHPNEKGFEPALTNVLERLKSRHSDRLR